MECNRFLSFWTATTKINRAVLMECNRFLFFWTATTKINGAVLMEWNRFFLFYRCCRQKECRFCEMWPVSSPLPSTERGSFFERRLAAIYLAICLKEACLYCCTARGRKLGWGTEARLALLCLSSRVYPKGKGRERPVRAGVQYSRPR